jgi:long-chain acyl-CoA synthetase
MEVGRDKLPRMSAAAYDDRPWLQHYPEGVPASVDVPAVPVTRLLDDAVAASPAAPAVTYAGRTLTYREIVTDVDKLAGALAGLGVGAGDRVALLLPNCPQHLIAFFATLRLGATVVQVNPLAAAAEIRQQFVHCSVSVVVCLDQALPTVAAARADAGVKQVVVTSLLDYYPLAQRLRLALPLPSVRRRRREIAAAVPEDADVVHFRTAIQSATPSAQAEVEPGNVAVVQYTSGTLGQPRPAMLTHRNLVANVHQVRAWLPDLRDRRESTLAVLPLFHAFGLTLTALLTVLVGGRLVLLSRYDADSVFDAIDNETPSLLPALPGIYRAMLTSRSLHAHDLRSLRRCISVGRPLAAEAINRFERLSGSTLAEGYGLTEATALALANPADGARRAGTVGLPLPGTDARIVDPRDPTRVLEIGERGELAVRGPQVFAGFVTDAADGPADEPLVDGWLLTGDLAVMDEDGWFTFIERKADVLTAGLLKVVPADIERVLLELTGVEDCSVVGVREGRRTVVTAFVVPLAGATIDETTVRAHLADRLPAKQQPSVVAFREQLPRSVIGHVQRGLLVSRPQTPDLSSTSSEHLPEPSPADAQSPPASSDSP